MLALATTALAACQDGVTAPASPGAPAFARDEAPPTLAPAFASLGGVVPTRYSGNTTGNGNAECQLIAPGSTAIKVEGASNRPNIGGWSFTVSQGGTRLAFAPAPGGATTAVAAVLVKGGDAFHAYSYVNSPLGTQGDSRLVSPPNGGGNIPQISHYTVCTRPLPPVTINKTLVNVWTNLAMTQQDQHFLDTKHEAVPMIFLPRATANDPGTRWLQYRIDYTLPAGTVAYLYDPMSEVCSVANTGAGIYCIFDNNPGATTGGSVLFTASGNPAIPSGIQVVGTGQVQTAWVTIDITNTGACGDHHFTNTARLTIAGGATFTATHTAMLWPACG
jgi:hypothetical protein